MSQENVKRFELAIEAFNRRDIPKALSFFDPQIQFSHRLAALQGDYTGLDGVKGFLSDIAEHFQTWQIDCPDVRDLGESVLGLGSVHATGTESGAETELPFTVVASFRDRRIIHFTDFGDRGAALEAAGLPE